MTDRYAIIENGIVTNVVAADAEFALQQGWIECPTHTQDGHAIGPGNIYQNGNFLPKPRNIEAEWFVIRNKRDYILLVSDTNVLPDRWAAMTTEQQTAWSTYRQALRDITTAFSDPADVVWPTQP
jgi:hypothetical protein